MSTPTPPAYPAAPTNLTCEYMVNPLGIDERAPRFSWWLNDPRPGARQTAWQIRVRQVAPAVDLWDSGIVHSDQTAHIAYGGVPLRSRQQAVWQVRTWDADGQPSPWSAPATFEMGLLEPTDWSGQWISLPIEGEYPLCGPATYLRRRFEIDRPVHRARLYITARGWSQPWLNGQRIGQDLLTPGWTDYRIRIRYQTYDVTEHLRAGANVLGAILGDGWYVGEMAWDLRHHLYGSHPELLAQLHVTFDDGSEVVIATDGHWQARNDGPIVSQSFLHGETIDLRRDLRAWSEPTSGNDGWQPVRCRPRDQTKLVVQIGETVQPTQVLPAVAKHRSPTGGWVFDFGQNMVGVVRLRIAGEPGQTLTLRHAEVLNPDGSLYLANLRKARCTDTFICASREEAIFQPTFTLHGFRYVEVDGLTDEPELSMVDGIVIGTATRPTGSFSCSHAKLNQLQRNIVWGQRGNFVEVPIDCPQRDERLGWTGDAQVFIRTAAFNMNVAPFFTRWLIDIADAQFDDGSYPHVVPDIISTPGNRFAGSPAWEDAGVICPWSIYRIYSDIRILERQYPSMRRYGEYLAKRCVDGRHPGDGFGDWLAIDSYTPMDLIGTAYSACSCRLLARIAAILGKADDAERFDGYFRRMRQAFQHHFVTPAGRIVGDSQTAYLLALAFDLVDGQMRDAAARYLCEDIERRGVLTTGFVGVNLLLPTLSRIGRDDLALRLLTSEKYPSWLYSVNHGATTIWERWDGWTEKKGFQDPGMNSFNHYAYGSCGEWMYARLGGIELDEHTPGYRRFHIRPLPAPAHGLTWAAATLDTINGQIAVRWELKDDQLTLNVVVPPQCSAIFHYKDGTSRELPAGTHAFTVPWPS